MPSRRSVAMIRRAISPRFATSTDSSTRAGYMRWLHPAGPPPTSRSLHSVKTGFKGYGTFTLTGHKGEPRAPAAGAGRRPAPGQSARN
jgi:hypothetical protein